MQDTALAVDSGSDVYAKYNAYNRFRIEFCSKARHNGNFRERRVNLGGGTEVIVSLSTRYDAANPVTWNTPLNLSVYTYSSGIPVPFVVSVDNVSGDLVVKGRGHERTINPAKSSDLLRDLADAAGRMVAQVTAAAEPQAESDDRYRFFLHFWAANQDYAAALADACKRVAEKISAETQPTRYARYNDGVRVRLRCTVGRKQDVVPLLRALMAALPKQHGFAGFSNDADSDDSFVRADDKAGVLEVFKALKYEALGAAEPRSGLTMWKRIDKANGHREVLTVRGARSPLVFSVDNRGGGSMTLLEQDPVPVADMILVRVHDTGMPGAKGFGAQVTKPLAPGRVAGGLIDITHALDSVTDDSPKALARVMLKVYFDYLKEHHKATAAAEPDSSHVTTGPILFNIDLSSLPVVVKKLLIAREPGDIFGDKLAGSEYAVAEGMSIRKELSGSALQWLVFTRPSTLSVNWRLLVSNLEDAKREVKKFVKLMHEHFGVDVAELLTVIKSAKARASAPPTLKGTKIDVGILRECAQKIGAATAAAEPGSDVGRDTLHGRFKITVPLVDAQRLVQSYEDTLQAAIKQATGGDVEVWITGPTARACVKISFTFNGRPGEHPANVAKAVAAQFTDVNASEIAADIVAVLRKPNRIKQLPISVELSGKRTLKISVEAAVEPLSGKAPAYEVFEKLVETLIKHPKAPFKIAGRDVQITASRGAGMYPTVITINVSGHEYRLKAGAIDDNVYWFPTPNTSRAQEQDSTKWDMSTPDRMLRIAVTLSVKAAADADKRASEADAYLRKLAGHAFK